MNRSLFTALGLCAAMLAQGAEAQTAPTFDLEIIGNGISVDIEADQDRTLRRPALQRPADLNQMVKT